MTTRLAVGIASLIAAAGAQAQTIGPDIVNSALIDVQRYGTDIAGTTTAYAVGAVTCSRGDLPAIVSPTGSTVRPLVAQNMYRLRADAGGAFARFEQIGQGWVKRVQVPGGGNNPTCGMSCTPGPSGTMGVGCADIYSSAFNGTQSLLGPRSLINPATAVVAATMAPLGENTTRGRVQVPTADVVGQPAGTRFFAETVHLLPDDAQYVRHGERAAFNAMNNASSQEININGGTANASLMGAGVTLLPAVTQWQVIDPAVTVVTVDHEDMPNPSTSFPGTFIRSRFYVAVRTTNMGAAGWRYEYAIYNLNSDRAGGSFTIPLPGSAAASDLTFHAPLSHSGEPFSNAAWATTRSGDTITFATDAFSANPNANAIRWGTMYNFGFTAAVAPTTGAGQLGLFKPGAIGLLAVAGLQVPTVRTCSADVNGDGTVGTDNDIEAYFSCLGGNCCPGCVSQDFDGDGDVGTDGDIESFFRVLAGGAC